MVSLRQVQYFVAVAEELSFVKAAKRLNITQPPLSSQVKMLEESLGVLLLRRDTRDLRLTDAGETFLKRGRQLINDVKVAIEETVLVGEGKLGPVSIGAVGSAFLNALPVIMGRLRTSFPEADFRVTGAGTSEQLLLLNRNEIDLGILHGADDLEGLEVRNIAQERFHLILPPTHKLAGKGALELSLFKHEPFINYPRPSAPQHFDTVVSACMQAGFSPRICHTGNFFAIAHMVAMGLGVALIPASLAGNVQDLVSVHDVKGITAKIRVDLVWRKDCKSAMVLNAVRAIEELMAANTFTLPLASSYQMKSLPSRQMV